MNSGSFYINNCLESIKTADLVLDNDLPIQHKNDGSFIAFINIDALPDSEANIFSAFCALFNIENTDNIGIAIYDEYNAYKYFTAPCVGIKDNQLCLMIGAEGTDTEGEIHQSHLIPLVWEPIDEDVEGELGTYYFDCGKKKLYASLVTIPSGYDGEMRSYIAVKGKVNGKLFIFNIAFRADKETLAHEILEAWNSGEFHNICKSFYSVSVNINKCFGGTFKTNNFPQDGVILVLKNGTVLENEYEGRILTSSRWELFKTSHPDLEVYDFDNEPVSLESIGSIYGSKSFAGTKQLIRSSKNNAYYICYVYGANTRDVAYIPLHVGSNKLRNMSSRIRAKFQDLFAELEQLLGIAPNHKANNLTDKQLVETKNSLIQGNTPVQTVDTKAEKVLVAAGADTDDIPF